MFFTATTWKDGQDTVIEHRSQQVAIDYATRQLDKGLATGYSVMPAKRKSTKPKQTTSNRTPRKSTKPAK